MTSAQVPSTVPSVFGFVFEAGSGFVVEADLEFIMLPRLKLMTILLPWVPKH